MDEVLVGQKAVLVMLRLPFSRRKTSFHMIGYSCRSVPVLVSPSPRVASDTTSVFGSARRDGRRPAVRPPLIAINTRACSSARSISHLKYAAVV
jgi:hypothetical protein